MEAISRSRIVGSLLRLRISFNSSSPMLSILSSFLRLIAFASTNVRNTGKPCRALPMESYLPNSTPINSTVSPGRTESTRSPVRNTSLLRGMRPAGTEPGDS